ncbi:GGDEF domain-containing protein [Niveibacterium sp. 24ML]|uniref:GGDEF domain-containing protein n=1 Tax=Niveibacterium sp. 24ML TaxID=2985512 RepID=UPI00226D5A2C|nr:GGDEF domain-containing protein [Niveibacterium sp. 24ML]MCX9156191.1 GGDEF domain-containing protein [Niveibacterium sp. 24ML]
MNQPAQTPSDIAREVLKRLAVSRVPPTPDNFRSIYHQIAGTQPQEDFPAREFKAFSAELPRERPEQLRLARRFEGAVSEGNWESFHSRMLQLFQEVSESSPPWASLIRELIAQLERRHANLTPKRKAEALEHVLGASQADPQQLFNRLQGLIKGWSGEATADSIQLVDAPADDAVKASTAPSSAPVSRTASSGIADSLEVRSLIAQVLEEAIGGLLIETPELSTLATNLANELRKPGAEFDAAGFTERLRGFAYKVEWVVRDQAGIRQALLRLLQLIIENIGDLVADDNWVHGQVEGVLQVTSGPLDRDKIDELGKRLRDVILKQGVLKKSLVDAQERLKAMLSGFVDHLTDFYATTGGYRDRLEHCATQVAEAQSIGDLASVVEEIIRETRSVQIRTENSRGELATLKQQADAASAEVARLKQELDSASEMVRHDPLTGALNRKGLDETLEREVGRAERSGTQICVALIDVDNFKQLNDTLGHTAGDEALVHLARVIGDTIRPQDSVARYGGEEFILVLPDTDLDSAVTVVQRLQRELTKRFFLHDNSKRLITFSAGVSELDIKQPAKRSIDRADEAMYRAKRAGKNRVEAAR